jgi:cation-transporting ATPase E
MSNQALTRRRNLWLTLALAAASLLAGLVRKSGLWRQQAQASTPPALAPDLVHFQGLSEEEARSRHSSLLAEDRKAEARRVRRDIWRSSALSIFNLGLVGLAAAQALLGDPLSALLTVGVLIFNIVFTAAQQLYATNQVERLLDQAQPLATTIRDGQIRSIELDEIVVGDTLIVGPGDQFVADGRLLDGRPQVIESAAAGGLNDTKLYRVGDSIREGSYCLNGRAIYQVGALPSLMGNQRWTPVQQKSEQTYLQRIMARVLRLMLLLITIFLALLVIDMNEQVVLGYVFEDLYREAASIFFSIAPSGLYFMIVATYALGSARLGGVGALIRDARAVEALAQVSVLCFGRTGTLTGADVRVQMIDWLDNKPALSESRTRQILGDLSHTIRGDNVFLKAVQDNFDGSDRPISEMAGLLSIYGWLAVTFAEADIRGTYVIAVPAVLEPHLADPPSPSAAAQNDAEEANGRLSVPEDEENEAGPLKRAGTLFGRARQRVGDLVQRDPDDESDEKNPAEPAAQLRLAYSPEPVSLYQAAGERSLPADLIPLCELHFAERVRAEAREAMAVFSATGVQIKLISANAPEEVFAAANEVGLVPDEATPQAAVTGPQLQKMGLHGFEQASHQATIFSLLTPQQKGEVVGALRHLENQVAVVGDSADDVAAMDRASLSLTLRGSSQAALSMADIVLLEDSFEVLPAVLRQGQFIVNGMLDILKINLAQIGYVTLLIIIAFLSDTGIFYYHPTQGGVIAFFTVIVPSLGLTFFASPGRLPGRYMRTRMAHFVIPAMTTMTIAALVISWIFRRTIDDIPYSELAVTHGLILMGLLLIVFVQPPSRFFVGGDILSGDWRSTYMAIVLLIIFLLATYLPLTQELLRLAPLDNARDYLIILGIALVWALILRTIWRLPGLNRYVGIVSGRLERP